MVGCTSAYLFPARKRKAVSQGSWNQDNRPPDTDENKGWEEKRDSGRIPIYSRKTRITIARDPDTPNN